MTWPWILHQDLDPFNINHLNFTALDSCQTINNLPLPANKKFMIFCSESWKRQRLHVSLMKSLSEVQININYLSYFLLYSLTHEALRGKQTTITLTRTLASRNKITSTPNYYENFTVLNFLCTCNNLLLCWLWEYAGREGYKRGTIGSERRRRACQESSRFDSDSRKFVPNPKASASWLTFWVGSTRNWQVMWVRIALLGKF